MIIQPLSNPYSKTPTNNTQKNVPTSSNSRIIPVLAAPQRQAQQPQVNKISSTGNTIVNTPIVKTVTPQKANFISTAGNMASTAQKKLLELSNGLKMSITKPSIISPIPDQVSNQTTKISEPFKIDIKPGQKKLTTDQMMQINPDFEISKQVSSAQITPKVQQTLINTTNKIQDGLKQIGVTLEKGVFDPIIQKHPAVKSFFDRVANTPVSPLGITPKMMENFIMPGTEQTQKLPLAIKLAIPALLAPEQITGASQFVGNLASLNPTWANALMVIVPEVTTIAGKAFVKQFGNEAINFLANKELLYKVTSETAKPAEIAQFKILNESGLVKEAARSPGGISVTNISQKKGTMWDLLRKIFPDGFTPEGKPTPDLPNMLNGKIEEMNSQLAKTEYTPQEILDTVVNSPIAKTADGKALIKTAVEAQNAGHNVVISSDIPSVGDIAKQRVEELKAKQGKTTETKVAKEAQPLIEEAKKYKSAEEFFLKSRIGKDLLREQGIKSQEAIKNYWNNLIKPTIEFEPSLEKEVIKKWGTTKDPEKASFISSDGKYISWGNTDNRLADHREIAGNDLQGYINKTKNIRVHNIPGSPDVNIDITYKPNKEQIPALKKMMEGKKIYSDISTLEGSNKISGEFNSFDEWIKWVEEHAIPDIGIKYNRESVSKEPQQERGKVTSKPLDVSKLTAQPVKEVSYLPQDQPKKIVGRSKYAETGIREAISSATSPQETITKLDSFVSEFKKGADQSNMADLRAGLVKEVTNLTGGTGDYKRDYAMRVALRNDVEIGDLVRSLEGHIDTIDSTIRSFPVRTVPESQLIPKPSTKTNIPFKMDGNSVMPVGEGKLRESTAFSKIKDRISNEVLFSEEQKIQSDYRQVNIKDQVEKAVQLLETDPKKAIRISLGLEQPPAGLLERTVTIAVAEKAFADGDMTLYSQVESAGSLRQTRRGQEIVADRGRFIENSPHTFMKDLLARRMDSLGITYKDILDAEGKKITSPREAAVRKIDVEKQKLKELLKKDQSKIKAAQDLIDMLRC